MPVKKAFHKNFTRTPHSQQNFKLLRQKTLQAVFLQALRHSKRPRLFLEHSGGMTIRIARVDIPAIGCSNAYPERGEPSEQNTIFGNVNKIS